MKPYPPNPFDSVVVVSDEPPWSLLEPPPSSCLLRLSLNACSLAISASRTSSRCLSSTIRARFSTNLCRPFSSAVPFHTPASSLSSSTLLVASSTPLTGCGFPLASSPETSSRIFRSTCCPFSSVLICSLVAECMSGKSGADTDRNPELTENSDGGKVNSMASPNVLMTESSRDRTSRALVGEGLGQAEGLAAQQLDLVREPAAAAEDVVRQLGQRVGQPGGVGVELCEEVLRLAGELRQGHWGLGCSCCCRRQG
ncbi:hypothetical protein VP1G_11153 [Cytospora mali]|uniref:Uncharacterized protein n=1 Tax=Cytospora mali TaxID=578113 RepID=A0A194V9D9_CYTMA|nr:hypothetical protein VP1G_11153 [Valsa mali var. pyri (nom. inval.)]